MEIIYNARSQQKSPFSPIRGGKEACSILQDVQKELLDQMAQALTIVYGGETKRRRGMIA